MVRSGFDLAFWADLMLTTNLELSSPDNLRNRFYFQVLIDLYFPTVIVTQTSGEEGQNLKQKK